MDSLEDLASRAREAIAAADSVAALENVRVDYLGKKGALTGLLKGLSALTPQERPAAGARINVVKQELQDAIAARRTALEEAAVNARLAAEALDVTLPGRDGACGHLHPVTRTIERMEDFFGAAGFEVSASPGSNSSVVIELTALTA